MLDVPLDVPVGPDSSIACTSRQKRCGGNCVALDDPTYGCDMSTCDTSSCPTVAAGNTLICQGSACVLGSCGGSTKKCGVQCVALTDPAYGCGATTCDATGCPNPGAGGTVTCMGTSCVIGTCPSGTKKCGNKCVGLGDPTYGCGATTCDATACPAAGSGTLVCQGGACVIGTCASGTKKCGDKCVPTDANNGCDDAARCTACAANETCVGSASTQCQCVPNNTAACAGKACGPTTNNCGTAITCPNTCTGVNTCGGGSGGPNACGCTPNNTAACAGKACGPAMNNCGASITCPNTCTGINTCGGGGAGANACGCTPDNVAACNGKGCGTATNNCGATVTCPDVCQPAGTTCCSGTCKNLEVDDANCNGCGMSCGGGYCVFGGEPSPCHSVPIVLNEMLIPWIELYNVSSSPFTMTGWKVIYSVGEVGQTMDLNATIPAFGYLAIDLGTYQYVHGVGIYDASANQVDGLGVSGPPESGSSFHRCPNGRGRWVSGPPTKGAANTCP